MSAQTKVVGYAWWCGHSKCDCKRRYVVRECPGSEDEILFKGVFFNRDSGSEGNDAEDEAAWVEACEKFKAEIL